MPVMDGYQATRILRNDKDYTIAVDTAITTPDSGKDVSSPRANFIEGSKGKEKEREKEKVSEGKGNVLLRDIPVIAMTASAIQGDREKCHEAGMDDYLAKPVERCSLEEMLVKWAGRKRDTHVKGKRG